MGREAVVKIIDDHEYTFHQMPPKQSMKLLLRIFKIVGAPAGAVADGAKANFKSLMDADLDISRIMGALCDRIDENEVEGIVDDLLSQAICKGRGEVSRNFDSIFKGRLPHLFKVVGAALQAEYSDFFDEWSGAARDLVARLAAMTPDPQT
ncbi:hypothetical protein DSCW_18150 [Desulfosarcina widdelii]|uniref:Uncharacterized protein n=1 Tax=Desulfosarcina widdelii TaxID=947919 RepID=A0A5K7Z0H6_9BACT|nr:putative phage tail assembly chaperone [Desulfosarcina widdelii]BBO74398.1 hypothetical protein DSCW_18150 [Desulfosarcina widdelii]